MVKQLFTETSVNQKWDLDIDVNPVEMQTNVFPLPQLMLGNKVIQFDKDALYK
jgi:hypothetical protein